MATRAPQDKCRENKEIQEPNKKNRTCSDLIAPEKTQNYLNSAKRRCLTKAS